MTLSIRQASVSVKEQIRYAVYFCPSPQSGWGSAGNTWLGRDVDADQTLEQVTISGLPKQTMKDVTNAPRRYGWHATLKAPFELAAETSLEQLSDSISRIARDFEPFALPLMQIRVLEGFLAGVPSEGSKQVVRLSNRLTMELQVHANKLTPRQIERRRASHLTLRQEQLMLCWGYPYVLEEFRFHFSLTDSLAGYDVQTVSLMQRAAEKHFPLSEALLCSELSLVVEAAPGADFTSVKRIPLGRAANCSLNRPE
jgi:2'-5' RNA ligase